MIHTMQESAGMQTCRSSPEETMAPYHALRSAEATLHDPWMDLIEDDKGLGLPQLSVLSSALITTGQVRQVAPQARVELAARVY